MVCSRGIIERILFNGYYNDCINYEDSPDTPLYPFGYGISYTDFLFTEISLSKDKITLNELNCGNCITGKVSVKNIGEQDGFEIGKEQLCFYNKEKQLVVENSTRKELQLLGRFLMISIFIRNFLMLTEIVLK